MAQWVKYLVYNPEDLSLILSTMWKARESGIWLYHQCWGGRDRGISRPRWWANMSESVGSGLYDRPCLKKNQVACKKGRHRAYTSSLHIYTKHTHTQTPFFSIPTHKDILWGFFWWLLKWPQIRQWWWLHNSVDEIKHTELHTFKGLIYRVCVIDQ